MKKKSVTLIISVAALAVLCGAYFALRGYNQRAEEKKEQEAQGETVLTVDTEGITSASFSIGGTPYTFEKADGAWTLSGDDSFPVDGDALEEALSKFSEIKALRTLEEIEDTSEFGMDAPQNDITLKMEDGTETHLTIGDTNEGTGDDYLMLASAPSTVYTVASTVRTALSDDLYDYAVSEQLPALTKDNITGIALDGGANTYALYREDDAWKLRDVAADEAAGTPADEAAGTPADETADTPADEAADTPADETADTPADTDAVDDLLTQLNGLYYSDYVEHNCADLSPYGLDNPAATLTVIAEDDITLTIKIGGTDEAGNYYTQLADSSQVHTISATVIDALLNATPESLEETETETETGTETETETGTETETETETEAQTAKSI